MDRERQSFGKADTSDAEPSFAELQRRIGEIPDGPYEILNTPKPYRVLNIIGGVGAIVALLPFVFVKLMTSAMWMVTMLRIGMAIMLVMWLPTMVRSIRAVGWVSFTNPAPLPQHSACWVDTANPAYGLMR